MRLSTLARDCLYVNWALPREAAPELPSSLRYEVHEDEDREWVFASALLFRLSGLRLTLLPFAQVSYPQMNLRLYVLDGRGRPSVLFLRMLVPPWVAPMSRLLGRQPATAASFSYPSPSDDPGEGAWTWAIEQRGRLELAGHLSSPTLPGHGPNLGPWEQTVAYFRNRERGYAMWKNRLRSIRSSNFSAEVWPLAVEVYDAGLVGEYLQGVDEEIWMTPHSAWLCPEIPFHFELGRPISIPIPPSGAFPAAEGC